MAPAEVPIRIRNGKAEAPRPRSRMARPAAFGQLIILLVFAPILTLEGVEGKTFQPMAATAASDATPATIFQRNTEALAAWRGGSRRDRRRVRGDASRLAGRGAGAGGLGRRGGGVPGPDLAAVPDGR